MKVLLSLMYCFCVAFAVESRGENGRMDVGNVGKSSESDSSSDSNRGNRENGAGSSSPVYHSIENRCVYRMNISTIIKTNRSLSNGANFLKYVQANTSEDCAALCCSFSKCDVAVYENKDEGSCYLFHCGQGNNCQFAQHSSYISMAFQPHQGQFKDSEKPLQEEKQENELEGLAKVLPIGLLPTTVKPTPTTATTTVAQARIVSLNGECTRIDKCEDIRAKCQGGKCICEEGFYIKYGLCRRHCSATGQFECVQKGVKVGPDCISLEQLCDGVPQCADGSDEGSCNPQLNPGKMTDYGGPVSRKRYPEQPTSSNSADFSFGFKLEKDSPPENQKMAPDDANVEPTNYELNIYDNHNDLETLRKHQPIPESRYTNYINEKQRIELPAFISSKSRQPLSKEEKADTQRTWTKKNSQEIQHYSHLMESQSMQDPVAADKLESVQKTDELSANLNTHSKAWSQQRGIPQQETSERDVIQPLDRKTSTLDKKITSKIVDHIQPHILNKNHVSPNENVRPGRKNLNLSKTFHPAGLGSFRHGLKTKGYGLLNRGRPRLVNNIPTQNRNFDNSRFSNQEPMLQKQQSLYGYTGNNYGYRQKNMYGTLYQDLSYTNQPINYNWEDYPSDYIYGDQNDYFTGPQGYMYSPASSRSGGESRANSVINNEKGSAQNRLVPSVAKMPVESTLQKTLPNQVEFGMESTTVAQGKQPNDPAADNSHLQAVTNRIELHSPELPQNLTYTHKTSRPWVIEHKNGENRIFKEQKVVVASPTDNAQGPIIALALGLSFTLLLLVFVGCRLRNVKRRLRKGRALHSNEADYLINGMYL